jgi:nifR3 family TIM-barrel protein
MHDSPNREEYLAEVADERCHVQIFGSDPKVCGEAARMLQDAGAKSLDFNCGCSVPKVRKGGGGSALLKDLGLLSENLKAVINAVGIPVSLKTRLGFYGRGDTSGLDACRQAADLGCAWVTLHGRTAKQGFDGRADWDVIGGLVSELLVPVIGNGDIFSPEDARRMFDTTGCAGVMIGRGLMGDPWLVGDCERFLREGLARPRRSRDDLVEVMLAHQSLLLHHVGPEKGVWRFRKHLSRYLRGFPQASQLRAALVRLNDPAELARRLREFGEGRPPARVADSVDRPT